MNGTAWTDPGQGATLWQLACAVATSNLHGLYVEERNKIPRLDSQEWERRTNLALTGEPLNEYDVRRIAQCKVKNI